MITQEQKYLRLQDLFMRLPYGVKIDNMGEPSMLISINHKYHIIVEIAEGDKNPSFNSTRLDVLEIEDAIPYLFPLSSMTEEQREELQELYFDYILDEIFNDTEFVYHYDCIHLIDWLNKNHFDYRGLIEKGLAIDATNKNIY